MNRIKDFFYNKNDLIIVLLILLLAVAIIYFRIGDIMSYPDTLKEAAAQPTTEQVVAVNEDSSADIGFDPTDDTTATILELFILVSQASYRLMIY